MTRLGVSLNFHKIHSNHIVTSVCARTRWVRKKNIHASSWKNTIWYGASLKLSWGEFSPGPSDLYFKSQRYHLFQGWVGGGAHWNLKERVSISAFWCFPAVSPALRTCLSIKALLAWKEKVCWRVSSLLLLMSSWALPFDGNSCFVCSCG